MPKVNLLETDSFERRLKNNVFLVKGCQNYETIAKQIRVKSAETARNKCNNPLNLTLRDVFYLCKRNHVDVVDFIGKELKLQ